MTNPSDDGLTFCEQYCVDVWKVAKATGDWNGAAYNLTLAALHADHAGYRLEAFDYSDMGKLADVLAKCSDYVERGKK
jgi:hypothetical protein